VSEVAPSLGVVRFGAFEVDFRKGEVRKHGYRLRIQDQPFHILQILLEHPGELVTREEIQRRIWPADTFVDFEKGLNNAIRKLRDALGDSAEEPRFIETHSRRGYRFIGSVTATNGASQKEKGVSPVEVSVPPPSRSLYRRLAVGAVLLLVFVATLFGFDVGGVREHWLTSASSPVIHSLAVLPLQNLSSDPSQEYFADGMTDALITDLAQIGSLKVISRTSTMRYKKGEKALPEIARELNVDGIIEGTVQRSDDRVRITAQLIYGPSDKHLWANSYERDARNVLAMESEIAGAIATQIQTKLSPEQEARLASARPINLKAFEANLQGKYHLTQADGLEYQRGQQETIQSQLAMARDFFQKAISEDPNYAPPYVGLAETWRGRSVAEQGPEKERDALQKALQLDPQLAEAHLALGYLELERFYSWADSEREIKRAMDLNPNLADAHADYSNYLDSVGRFDEGMREYLRAQELDPGHYAPTPNPFYTRRQFDKAMELDRNDIARHAFGIYPLWDLARNYEAKGMHDEAIREWEVAMRMLGYEDMANAMNRAFEAKGYKGALKEWVRELELARAHGEDVPAFVLAEVYTYLGDKDHAFVWLEKAYEERESALPTLKVDVYWDNIRPDPRFQNLVRRVGLPE
jgi:TolB-like protein/DNA-binding winged helix-turn-helix (wHTH) protein/Tfp pilus assembly protein PilF